MILVSVLSVQPIQDPRLGIFESKENRFNSLRWFKVEQLPVVMAVCCRVLRQYRASQDKVQVTVSMCMSSYKALVFDRDSSTSMTLHHSPFERQYLANP